MAVVLVGLTAGTLWFVRSAPTEARLGEPAVDSSAQTDREARAADLLERLERAVETVDRAAATDLAAGDRRAGRELDVLLSTAEQLELETFDLRYVSASTLDGRDRERWGPEAFTAHVDLTWQLSGFDQEPSSVEVPIVLADDGASLSFVTARTPTERAPIWFNDRVTVERPRQGLLIVVSLRSGEASLADLSTAGVRTVRDALPQWDGRAVVEAPGTAVRFALASGLRREAARGIAAVTTSSDGAAVRGAPQRIFLNPAVFGPLSRTGQQIVVSHELTHVAVDGATSAMPLWLSEGYADYVAIRDTGLPVRTLAAQILRLVRSDGAPRRLPAQQQFQGTDPNVGAWYESAWLAARLLAAEYGEPALHAFYRQADRDGGTDRAFDQIGTTERAFTRTWRAELERLAG